MKRSLLCLMLLALSASGSPLAASEAKGPPAVLTAADGGKVTSQSGKIIVSTWGGNDYDNSYPPIEWPRPMKVASTSELAITISTIEPPEVIEVRMWKVLGRKGVPRGKPVVRVCYLAAPPGECSFIPSASAEGVGWQARLESPWSGHVYAATSANWPDAQVAWINHAILRP